MEITLRQLNYLVALSQERNFGRAAARVHVTQPALSVQIRELEQRLGVTLVERQPRDVVFTQVGREVLENAERVLADVRALQDAARLGEGLSGRLTLGVIPTVAPYLLPAALPILRAQNVSLDLRIRESRTEVLLAELQEGILDAAVIALPSGQATLVELPLFEDPFLLAGSGDQIAALHGRADGLRPTSIDPERLLLLEEGHCLADQALEVCGMERSATRVDLSASSLGTLCRLVSEGFGLTFLPQIALGAEKRAVPEMAVTRFDAPEPARLLGLVRRSSSPGGAWFEDLAATLRRAADTLMGAGRE